MPVPSELRFLTPESAPAQIAVCHYGSAPSGETLQAVGKGWTRPEAARSALGEAVERESARHRADDPHRRASLEALGDEAIHPNRCMQFSNRQLNGGQDRQRALLEGRDIVPERLPEDAIIPWTELHPITEGGPKWLPAGCVYFGLQDPSAGYCRADSVGLAAGDSLESALVAGLLELVERDAVAIWWYNRLPVRRIPPVGVDPARVGRLKKHLADRGRSWWLLDITTDLGIPVVASLSPAREAGQVALWGFGAGRTFPEAVARATVEMTQGLPLLDTNPGEPLDSDMRFLTETQALDSQHLAGGRGCEVAHASLPPLTAEVLSSHLADCGLPAYYVDLTRPEHALPVARAVVPGMRNPSPRFAHGRLFAVPVTLGYRDRPILESDLNPMPFVL